MKKIFALFVGLAIGVFPFAARAQAAVQPIRIGHIADLTGVEAMLGEVAKRSLEFAVKSIGGQISGRPVEIVLGDAQGQPSVAVDVARKMVEQDQVAAIFGPTQIGQKMAVAGYMKTAGIPLFFYTPTPIGLLRSNDWLVGSGGTIPQMPSVMGDYVYNDLGYRKIHTLTSDNTGSRSFMESFVEVFKKLGGTVVSQQWAPMPCADFAPYLATLGDADALVAWASSSDAVALWTAWYEMGIHKRLPIVTTMHGGFTDYFVADALAVSNPAAAEAMLGTFAPIGYVHDLDIPENKTFVEGWTKEFGSVPPGNNLPGDAMEAILLLKTAVEKLGGDTDPNKLIKAVFEVDVVGPEGHLTFNNSRAATKDIYVAKLVRRSDGSFNYERQKTYKDVPPGGLSVK